VQKPGLGKFKNLRFEERAAIPDTLALADNANAMISEVRMHFRHKHFAQLRVESLRRKQKKHRGKRRRHSETRNYLQG
jgi:hypothetical protein